MRARVRVRVRARVRARVRGRVRASVMDKAASGAFGADVCSDYGVKT